jgi:diguanylate cyclase (GGDEF)-like protein
MTRPVILCVDDERIILSSLKAQLHNNLSADFEIEVAESAEEALEIIHELIDEKIEVPVVIADQIMPGMKGDELLGKIKLISPQTLTIMLTGQASADAVGKAVNKAGLFRYLSKPWDEDDLILTIQSAIDSYAHQQNLLKQSCYQSVINQTLSLAISTLNFKQQTTKALNYLLTVPCLDPPAQGSIYFSSLSHVFDRYQPEQTTLLNNTNTHEGIINFKKVCAHPENNTIQPFSIEAEQIAAYSEPLFIKKTNDSLAYYSYPILLDSELIGLIFIYVKDSFKATQEITSFLSSFSQTLASMYRLSTSNHALRLSNLQLEKHKRNLELLVEQRTKALNKALNKQEENNAKLRTANKELAFFATTDFLTGLLNRRYFFELAEKYYKKLLEHQLPGTVAMIDVDFFKNINDTYGHQAGDELLKKVAKSIQCCFDKAALVGRLGGEEFALLLPETDLNTAHEACKYLLTHISDTKLMSGSDAISVTASIGLSEIFQEDTSIEKALLRADKALYSAKDSGRNTIAIFDGDLR